MTVTAGIYQALVVSQSLFGHIHVLIYSLDQAYYPYLHVTDEGSEAKQGLERVK